MLQSEADFYAGNFEGIHIDGCPETLWVGNRLITETELSDELDNCPACWAEWQKIDNVVNQCGDAFYYNLAIRALHEHRAVELYHLTLKDLSAVQVEMIDAADRALGLRRKQQEYVRYRESKS